MCVSDRKSGFRHAKTRAFLVISALTPLGLGACSTVGPASIDQGRTTYNQVIQDTSAQQTLLNVIRVRHSETPLFMDVTEVDAATILQTSISGGPQSLGASPNFKSTSAGVISGAVGFITGNAAYQEAPTVRYQPLSGQALIAQVSTPMTAEALANLFSSDWSLVAILALSVDRLTPNFEDFEPALNAIVHLDKYGAIVIAATPSAESSDKPKTSTANGIAIVSSSPPKNDSLTIYYRPKHPLVAQANCDRPGANAEEVAQKHIEALWKRLKNIFGVQGDVDFITLSTKPSSRASYEARGGSKFEQHRPPVQTRSALGVLKAAAEPEHNHFIAVMRPADVRALIDQHKTLDKACADDFYSVDLGDRLELDELEQDVLRGERNQKLSALVHRQERPHITAVPEKSELSSEDIRLEAALAHARRFMLIAVSDDPPSNAFVSVRYNGKWYYIFNDDTISKRTLALITQLATMLAAPPQSPPLTPTISVGAR